MEIDTSSSAKSSSSMDCSPAGSKCSYAKSLMDEDITPEKTTTTTTTVLTPMDCSNKTASSIASSPSINSPIAASAGSDSSILPPKKKKKKAELTWELNEDGVKVYTLRCGCGDIQRLMASEGNIFRIHQPLDLSRSQSS